MVLVGVLIKKEETCQVSATRVVRRLLVSSARLLFELDQRQIQLVGGVEREDHVALVARGSAEEVGLAILVQDHVQRQAEEALLRVVLERSGQVVPECVLEGGRGMGLDQAGEQCGHPPGGQAFVRALQLVQLAVDHQQSMVAQHVAQLVAFLLVVEVQTQTGVQNQHEYLLHGWMRRWGWAALNKQNKLSYLLSANKL